jgi:hypothetical protein
VEVWVSSGAWLQAGVVKTKLAKARGIISRWQIFMGSRRPEN